MAERPDSEYRAQRRARRRSQVAAGGRSWPSSRSRCARSWRPWLSCAASGDVEAGGAAVTTGRAQPTVVAKPTKPVAREEGPAVRQGASEAPDGDRREHLPEVRGVVGSRLRDRAEHDVPPLRDGLRRALAEARQDDLGRREASRARVSRATRERAGARPSRRRSRRTAATRTSRTTRCTGRASGRREATAARRRPATTQLRLPHRHADAQDRRGLPGGGGAEGRRRHARPPLRARLELVHLGSERHLDPQGARGEADPDRRVPARNRGLAEGERRLRRRDGRHGARAGRPRALDDVEHRRSARGRAPPSSTRPTATSSSR